MQIKTVKLVLTKKLNEWLNSISDEKLRELVKKNLLVSGGSITSMLLKQPVNDYDVYIQDIDVLLRLAQYYCPERVLDGRLRDVYIASDIKELGELYNPNSELSVRLKNLKPNQVKLNISSVGERFEPIGEDKYQVAFLSQNAISLTDDIQIVLRFSGNAEQIHKTFDFVHATNYFTFDEGLVLNQKALESILTRSLSYQGSLYPLTSIIRMKKFLNRGWTMNAGEILKVMFQISELDLKNPEILEEQLIGVDIAYFARLIDILRGVPSEKLTSSYLNELIDRVFNTYEEEEEEFKPSNN